VLATPLTKSTALHSVAEYGLDELLTKAIERWASDLHLTAGLPPVIRVNSRLQALPFQPVSPRDTQRLVYECLTDRQISIFEDKHELDLSYAVPRLGRFRVNVFMQRAAVAGAFRIIPSLIPSFEELHLPPVLRTLAERVSGLVLVTGPTGCGKSTTLAAMIDHINSFRDCHVVTIEDPIEYLHEHRRAMINQRELGSDTYGFAAALRSVLREDPDVVLIGEMRDLETIASALTIAETGHLVFGTLHTRNAPQSIDRIIDVFPPHQQEQTRVQLAGTLEAVVAQQLLPRPSGLGRLPAVEVMVATPAIRNLMREAKCHQIYSLMEAGGEHGMETMDRCLARLCRSGQISKEEAWGHAVDADNFRRWLTTL